jgi:hypothetical protein
VLLFAPVARVYPFVVRSAFATHNDCFLGRPLGRVERLRATIAALFLVVTTSGRKMREAAARSPMMGLGSADRTVTTVKSGYALTLSPVFPQPERRIAWSLCFLSEAPTKASMNSPRNG